MAERGFWLSNLRLEGPIRLSRAHLEELSPLARRFPHLCLRTSPGWCELTYLNTLTDTSVTTEREWLLAWVFATTQGQHGFALDLAARAAGLFGDPIFPRLRRHSALSMRVRIRDLLPYVARQSGAILRRVIRL
jgi:hypothetical protein